MVSLADLFLPQFCVGCGMVGVYICHRCAQNVRIIEPSEMICPMCDSPGFEGLTHPKCNTKYALKGLLSLYHYSGPIKKLIKLGKYKFAYHALDWLMESSIKSRSFEDLICIENYTIVPIPLHPRKQRERGFNQAEIIAKALAKSLNRSLNTRSLVRKVYTNPQAELKTKIAREAHMKGVFAVSGRDIPLKVLLVDDVFTTGATMKEATKALKSGGVQEVFGFTIAR